MEPARLDADFFEADGWIVNRRPYGTRVYAEMFTLLEHTTHEPFIEVRRRPLSSMLDESACHIRLTNRTCYYDHAALIMDDFLHRYNYTFFRISRIDICLDFELFDSYDSPQRFVQRYLSGRYSRMFTSGIRAIGKDHWDGRAWNSLSWGSPKSMIGTKLYNKTMEIKERTDKPYIRQAWAACGLVDDFQELTKINKKGEIYCPSIWRLEFSIKSSVKRWFVLDVDKNGDPTKRSIHNTLDCYYERNQLLDVFASLTDHYFHFKYVVDKPASGIARNTIHDTIQVINQERTLQRKDRCPDKILFKFDSERGETYKIDHVSTATPKDRHDAALLRKLEEYKLLHPQREIEHACDVLIRDIRMMMMRKSASDPANQQEIALLQTLIALRIKAEDKQSITIDDARAMMTIFDDFSKE